MKPDTSDVSGAKKALSLSILTLGFCWLVFGKFLSGEVLFYHDSTQAFSLAHIFFQHLCNFKLALWSPELNSGQPVWPILEAFPLFDPVLLLVWCVGNLFGIGSVLLGKTGVIAWLFAFSIGGLMLSRRLTRNWHINLAVFALLFGGPIAWGLPAQWSLLLPFRYTPFVLLTAVNLIDNPNRNTAITFGIVFAISQCGYQLGYSLFYVLVFTGAYAFSLHRQRRLPAFPAKTAWIASAVFLAGTLMLPAIVWKLRQMVALPRAYGYTWNFNPEAFFAGLFLPYYTTPYGKLDIGNTWHGSAMLGLPAAALLLVPIAVFAAGAAFQRQTPQEPQESALTNAWLAATAAGAVLCLGLFGLHKHFTEGGYFLFLRNWGYELTLVLLGMTQLAALGANQLQKRQEQGRHFLVAYGIIFFLAALYLLTRGPAISLSRTALFFLLVPVPLFFGLFYWAGKTLSSQNFGILVFACVSGLLALHIVKITPVKGHIIPPPFKLSPQKTEPKLPEYRDWLFPCERYAPFEMLGPAVVGHFSATMPNSITSPHALVIDLIQTRRYRNLIAEIQNAEVKKKILGVTAPILRTVDWVSFAATEAEALEKLSAVRNPAELDDWAVVEGSGVAASISTAQDPRNSSSGNKITLKHYAETKTLLEAEMARDGLLIFADNWDPDWKVYVDGKQSPLLIANLTNKAVFLPKGGHEVEFVYFPAFYVFAFWSRMAFYLFATLLAGLSVFKKYRLPKT